MGRAYQGFYNSILCEKQPVEELVQKGREPAAPSTQLLCGRIQVTGRRTSPSSGEGGFWLRVFFFFTLKKRQTLSEFLGKEGRVFFVCIFSSFSCISTPGLRCESCTGYLLSFLWKDCKVSLHSFPPNSWYTFLIFWSTFIFFSMSLRVKSPEVFYWRWNISKMVTSCALPLFLLARSFVIWLGQSHSVKSATKGQNSLFLNKISIFCLCRWNNQSAYIFFLIFFHYSLWHFSQHAPTLPSDIVPLMFLRMKLPQITIHSAGVTWIVAQSRSQCNQFNMSILMNRLAREIHAAGLQAWTWSRNLCTDLWNSFVEEVFIWFLYHCD